MFSFSLRKSVVIGVAWVMSIGLANADPPQSSFELDGVRQEFSEVSAFRIRDRHNFDEFKTLVLLTKTTPDREAIRLADDPYAVAINDPATASDYLTFVIDKEGVVGMNASIGGVQYLDSSGTIMGSPGSLKAQCSANSDTRVACSVKTPTGVKTPSGPTWKLEASFECEVLSRPQGKPVAEGGGAAGEALAKLEAALATDELESILALLSDRTALEYRVEWRSPEENLQAVKEDLGRMLPSNAKVKSGEWRGDDQVILIVQGNLEGWGDDEVIFRVTMQRAEDRWGFDHAQYVGMAE